MNKHRRLSRPLAAAIGLLAFLVVPAVAQAHHLEVKATCKLVDNASVVDWQVKFAGFSSPGSHDPTGTVKLDGAVVGSVPPDTVIWNGNDGYLSGRDAAAPDRTHTLVAEFSWKNGHEKKSATTEKCPKPAEPAEPAIALDKTGAATAAAGSTFTYTFKATNVGNVMLTNVVLTDDRCQATLTRVEPNAADPTFDPGDEWFYTCTLVAPPGPAQVDNLAQVCGDYQAPDVAVETVCDDDPHTFTVPPPATPVTTPPAQNTPSTPPGTSVLPGKVVSGRAVLRGPGGCVKQAFRARVRGRSIAAVTFFVDGRRVKRITGGSAGYSLRVRPGRLGVGRHKIVARVEFTAASGTEPRRLPLTFRRCAQGTATPRFTG